MYTWMDRRPSIWYVYPIHHKVSFNLIAEQHIRQIRKKYKVQKIEERGFLHVTPRSSPFVIVHPLLYICGKNVERFAFVRGFMRRVIGVEVADSNRVSMKAVTICNIADALIVPSTWAREAYIKSGVAVPVHVVPHGLSEEFYKPPMEPENDQLKFIKKIKKERNYIYLLFFLWHSSWRKGADLVYKVTERICKERDNVVLILKGSSLSINSTLAFNEQKTILVTGWLSNKDLVALYDMCDIYLLFSRGGGFELNGLEALARGLVVVAPEKGSWTDYLPKESLVPIARWVHPLPNNEYHIGLGGEIDTEKAVDKILSIIDDLDEWKARYREYAIKAREKYSWDKVGEILLDVIDKYY